MTSETSASKTRRPRIDIPRTGIDTVLEVACTVALIALWGYTILNYSSLPPTIPIHFDLSGRVDGTGARGVVWLLPMIASIIYVLLGLASRIPHTFNYLRPITPENALHQYTLAVRMMRTLKLGIALLMLVVQAMTVLTAQERIAEPPFWIIGAAVALVLLPVGFYVVRSLRTR